MALPRGDPSGTGGPARSSTAIARTAADERTVRASLANDRDDELSQDAPRLDPTEGLRDSRERVASLDYRYDLAGRASVRELLGQNLRVAVVADAPEQVANLRALAPPDRLFATFGAAAELEILRRVNVPSAHSVIVCTPDDATNMIASLNARSIAPKARIVVSVQRPELRDTLRSAGVTYVASPSEMGGRMCAAAAFEPEVAHALEDISAADVQSDMQEYLLPADSPLANVTFEEAERLVRKVSGALLVGQARRGSDGEFVTTVNPPPDTRLQVGDAILLLGQIPNLKRFREWFGRDQGR